MTDFTKASCTLPKRDGQYDNDWVVDELSNRRLVRKTETGYLETLDEMTAKSFKYFVSLIRVDSHGYDDTAGFR